MQVARVTDTKHRPAWRQRRTVAKELSLERLVQSYLLACEAEGMSPDTLRWYRQKLGAFLRYLSETGATALLADLTPEAARAFVVRLQNAGRTAFTARGYVQVLKGFGTWLLEEGYLRDHPLRRLPLPKVPRYVVKPLSGQEVSGLIGVPDRRSPQGARDLAILLLLLDTGMRLGEVAGLTMSDAEDGIRDGLFKVMGKGSRERYLPLGRAARDALRRYLQVHRVEGVSHMLFLGREGRPLAAEGLRQVIRRLASRAGVTGVHPHRLRHTFAVNYLMNGGDAMSLQRILGHSTLEMVRNYVGLDLRDVKSRHDIASPGDRFWADRGSNAPAKRRS